MHDKKSVVMVALVVLLFSGQTMAQTTVLDKFQLGKSTYDEVKANLPKGVLLVRDDPTPIEFYGGRTFSTDGTGYGVDGLRSVNFSFDEKQTMVAVGMMLESRRFKDLKNILVSKYHYDYSKYKFTYMLFKSQSDWVTLFIPQGKVFSIISEDPLFVVEYVTAKIARKQSAEERYYIQPYDRKISKRPARAVSPDRSKF